MFRYIEVLFRSSQREAKGLAKRGYNYNLSSIMYFRFMARRYSSSVKEVFMI